MLLEFVLEGPPMSARSHNHRALIDWKLRVQAAAAIAWPHEVFRGKVHVVVTYYHAGESARLDTDNMVKPILDALAGVVYQDDRQASHIEIRSLNIRRGLHLPQARELVLAELERGREFLHVLIREEQ